MVLSSVIDCDTTQRKKPDKYFFRSSDSNASSLVTMISFHRDKKEDDEAANAFANLDRVILLQEAKYFNSTIVNPKKCIHILTRTLYFLNQGHQLTEPEATSLFFTTTKLFPSKDLILRRLVYLCIKELSPLAQDVIIVMSSLTKDVSGPQDIFRAAAIRALCCITDCSMLPAIERYMKQAIVDRNPAVSSAALVSALHLSQSVPDLIRRWVNEVQEAVFSNNFMVSYHAFALLASARRNDRLAMVKLIKRLVNAKIHSSYALCLLIRYAAKLADEEKTNSEYQQYLEFIESCLHNRPEIVVFEAAYAIVNMKKPSKDIAQAVSVLQVFCGSSKATLRLAGTRTLAKLALRHPNAIYSCTVDLEHLISDSNRCIATLSVTTLLSTGTESSIDRLMKPMASFMSDIPDEFKIIVVGAIHRLCSKYPRKYKVLSTFLAGMLKDCGGLQYKTAVADVLISLIEENPRAKETGLSHLCEFIEDCEHTSLAVRILHVLGREGPTANQPSRYIRYIYNRVILECGVVRAAAVSAVARFGATCPELLPNIKVLLSRCQLDDEDEVRDRAIFYGSLLSSGDNQLINDFIVNVNKPNLILLEKALREHVHANSEELFNIASIPMRHVIPEERTERNDLSFQKVFSLEEQYEDQLKVIPGIEKFGRVFKTCKAFELTEPETEYRVRCVKHIFARHLVLQFECLNTLANQILHHVHIRLVHPPSYKLLSEVPCERLPFEKQGSVFCLLEFPENPIESLGTFGVTLEFKVYDCDKTGFSESGGYADSYPLEEVEIGCSEQLRSYNVINNIWGGMWDEANTEPEACNTFELPQSHLQETAKSVCEHLGLSTAGISEDAKEIRGYALWREDVQVLVRARLVRTSSCVVMQLCTRCARKDIMTLLLAAVG